MAAGCADRESGGPRGEPEAVVGAAPDRTFRQRSAHVEAASLDARSEGRVRFAAANPPLVPTGRGAAKGYPELARPLALVDLVRGAAEVVSYGGVALRGTATFRYETVIDVGAAVRATPEERRGEVESFARSLGAPAFYADVWVDGRGRIRRVQVPEEKTTRRPGSRDRRLPRLITVDLFGFDPP